MQCGALSAWPQSPVTKNVDQVFIKMLQIVKEMKNCYHDYLVFILRGSFCM
jgi:hypothetical protein